MAAAAAHTERVETTRRRAMTQAQREEGTAVLPSRFDARPMYRAVEVTRDAQGRLQLEGKVWQPDLASARKFGRALACRSAGQRVMVANSAGRILEELPVAPAGAAREFSWAEWQSLEVPPLGPLPARALLPGSPQPRAVRPLVKPTTAQAPGVEVVLP
jgi:hypothetical protein